MASPRRGSPAASARVGEAGGERVQVRRGDDEQRRAVDAEVVEPVADERAALERGWLDVVDGDGDRAARAPSASARDRASARSSRRRARPARPPTCARARPPARRGRAARARSGGGEPGHRVGERARRGGHSTPERPSSISSAGPPASTATTGSPEACASSTTCPNVSVCEQNRKRSRPRRRGPAPRPRASRETSPPRRAARAARPPRGRRRPARARSRGSRARAARNASASRSTPFSRVSRPA